MGREWEPVERRRDGNAGRGRAEGEAIAGRAGAGWGRGQMTRSMERPRETGRSIVHCLRTNGKAARGAELTAGSNVPAGDWHGRLTWGGGVRLLAAL